PARFLSVSFRSSFRSSDLPCRGAARSAATWSNSCARHRSLAGVTAEKSRTRRVHSPPRMSTPPSHDAAIAAAMERTFGITSLRPLQRDAIDAALAMRDALVVLPTGGGKSLCYQIPPLVTGKLTVVVSPLIALMQDQVDGLRLLGYPAAAVHSNLDAD